ncbi:MAG: twin-arginine translocase subunit TatC [Candidatus Brocadiales bacterium]
MAKEVEETKERVLTFGEHIEELRTRVIIVVIAISVCFILCWCVKNHLLTIVKRPHTLAMQRLNLPTDLRVLSYQEGFYSYMKLCLIGAIFLSYPIIVYQAWKFVSAGLYGHERFYAKLFTPISFGSFLVGGLFGYFVLIPIGLQFLIAILGPGIEPIITMGQYISLVFLLILAFGVIFQLPLIMFFISKLGLLQAEDFKKWRKYSVLGAFVAAAILTPTPDPFTQCAAAIPMLGLYEIGIFATKPTKKGFVYIGSVLGVIGLGIGAFFLLFNLPAEATLLKTSESVYLRPIGGSKWRPISDESGLFRGTMLRTGKTGKAAVLLKDGSLIIANKNTRVRINKGRSLGLIAGQILISVKKSDKPFKIMTRNGNVTTSGGELDVQASKRMTIVTAVKGDAILSANNEEKKLFEGRQAKMTVGGRPVDVEKIIEWAEGLQPEPLE